MARAEAHEDDDGGLPELEMGLPGENPAADAQMPESPPPGRRAPPPPSPKRLTKNQKKNLRGRQMRNALRGLRGGGPKACSEKYRASAKTRPLKSDVDLARDLPHSKPAWVGLREVEEDRSLYGLAELQGTYGLRLFEWDGRATHPIVDSEGRLIGLLAGRPQNDAGWGRVSEEAAAAIEGSRDQCDFTDKHLHHRRGAFPAVAVGISHGNGTQAPGNLNAGKNAKVLSDLLELDCFKRIAGFTKNMFQVYFPNMHSHYQKTLDELIKRDPTLRRTFPGTPFAAASINLGPQTACYPHCDWANFAAGQCTITSLGDFDADRGGHLAFWDLGLVVRFPPGSVIFLPSALVRHSNTPVAPHEHRYSFAQYTAGGIFRWVSNGFKLGPKKLVESDEVQRERWIDGVALFSKLADL